MSLKQFGEGLAMINDDRLTWRKTTVAGRAAHYGVGGRGRPVLFVHGWGLTSRTYEHALRRLVASGMRVYAPSLPGFGDTAPLPPNGIGIGIGIVDYARWLMEFTRAVGIDEPVVVVGHSFGGGVAIRFAHDHPQLLSSLVLVNSVGGSAWCDRRGVVRPMADRPLWDWGLQLRSEVRPDSRLCTTVPRVVREAMRNAIRHPATLWRVANLARTADLAAELAVLRHRNVAVTIAWSDGDNVIPRSAVAALRSALGEPPCVTVPGGHGWLIDSPRLFGEVMADALAAHDIAVGCADVAA